MMPLSVVLITFNEEKSIERCLKSVLDVADEIVVVDSYSSDHTTDICQKYGARVLSCEFLGYGAQKRFAVAQATFNHILCIDADEELSETLKQSVLEVKKQFNHSSYSFNRLNFYCNKPIHFCGWYPDTQLRLFNREYANWNTNEVHEKIIVNENQKPIQLKGDLNHYTCQTISEHQEKELKYARINASILIRKKVKILPFTPRLKKYFRFLKTYLIKLGILDGYYGFVISKTVANSSYLKYSIARKELNKKSF